MANTYTVTGTLTDGRTLVLNEPLPITTGKVRVTVEVMETAVPPRETLEEFLDALHARRTALGVQPLTAEEIDEWVCEIQHGRGN